MTFDDVDLAAQLLAGSKKAMKSFERRFGQLAEMAFEHCRDARRLGLAFERYIGAVAVAAAEGLIRSVPLHKDDIGLDAHVSRVLGHRDFALALLLREGHSEAWSVFTERFDSYLRGLFIRAGCAQEESEQMVADLVRELRTPTAGGAPPICEYRGASDLRLWLFVFVRLRFRGGMEVGRVEVADETPRPLTDPGIHGVVSAAMEEAAEHEWAFLQPAERQILATFSVGASLLSVTRAPKALEKKFSARDVLTTHARLIEALWSRIGKKLEEKLRHRIPDIAERWPHFVLRPLRQSLSRICAIEVTGDETAS